MISLAPRAPWSSFDEGELLKLVARSIKTGQGVQGTSALRAEMTEMELDIHVPTINIKPLLEIAGSTYT